MKQTEPVTDAQAADAIESLDDYARMMVGVDPAGPRETLYRYLEQTKLAQAEAERTARNRDMWQEQCRAQAAELERLRTPAAAIISAYRLSNDSATKIERVQQVEGADLWAVRRNGDVLNKQGAWEWEPRPSERDDNFLTRCRFATSAEAIFAAAAAAQARA